VGGRVGPGHERKCSQGIQEFLRCRGWRGRGCAKSPARCEIRSPQRFGFVMLLFYHYRAILDMTISDNLTSNRSFVEHPDVFLNSPAGSFSSVHRFPAGGAPICL
jgi:hypothetical protein